MSKQKKDNIQKNRKHRLCGDRDEMLIIWVNATNWDKKRIAHST